MQEIIAAGIQIAVTPMDVNANVEKAIAWLKKAVTEYQADLAVFPESVTTGFTPGIPAEELWHRIDPVPGPAVAKVADAARQLKVHVVLPLYERGTEKGVIYNSSVLINDCGEVVGIYRKTHPFPTERLSGGGWTTPGYEAPVFSTRLGHIGMIICYDGDFPELSRVMALKGAEIITRPSALLRSYEIWEMTNMARAYDNHVYMVAVNAVGSDAGGTYYFGHSMIISPIAQKLALARGTEEIIAARLSPNPIQYVGYGSHSPMLFDHLQDRNVAAYEGILGRGQSPFEPSRRIPY